VSAVKRLCRPDPPLVEKWCGKAGHQTIVNALGSCRRAAGDKCLDRPVRRLCHRQNFLQSLFSVPVFLLVFCIL
jgi:hypothetical protein